MKDIPGFHGRYAITKDGKVWSHITRKFLLIGEHQGYWRIILCPLKGIRRTYKIHRLIALTYIPNPENKAYINHKNGDKKDNRIGNLEWCDMTYNNRHALSTGLRKMPSAVNHWNYKHGRAVGKYHPKSDSQL